MFNKKRITELEKRVSELEQALIAQSYIHGEMNFRKIVRVVDDIEKKIAASKTSGKR